MIFLAARLGGSLNPLSVELGGIGLSLIVNGKSEKYVDKAFRNGSIVIYDFIHERDNEKAISDSELLELR